MEIKETYIWLDEIKEKFKDYLVNEEISAIELCKLIIKEKMTGYADERVK